MKSPLIRLTHERPKRCPLCDALLGENEMGVRSHFRRHLRDLAGQPLKTPHVVFFKFLGPEYWRTSIFVEYAKKHMNPTALTVPIRLLGGNHRPRNSVRFDGEE